MNLMIPVTVQEEKSAGRTYAYGTVARAGIGAAYVPLISIMPPGPIKLHCAHLLVNDPVIWQVRIGAELVGDQFEIHPDEPATMVDNEAASLQGGSIVLTGLCAPTTAVGAETEILEDFTVPEGTPVTLCARRVEGFGGIITATLVWENAT